MNHDNGGRETDFKLDEEKKTKREGERERSREHSMMIRMIIMIKSKKEEWFWLTATEPVSSNIPAEPEAWLTPSTILLPLVAGSINGGIKEGSLSCSPRRSTTFSPFVNLPDEPSGKSIP